MACLLVIGLRNLHLKGYSITLADMQWPTEIEKVILLVAKEKEKERYERILPHFIARGIPEEKIVLCAPTWGDELTSEKIFSVYDPFLREGMPILTFKARSLSRGEISLNLNFIAAAELAVENNWKNVLMFESDTWLREDFVPRLSDLMQDLKGKEWDYVSLGEGARTRPHGCNPSFYAKTKAYVPNHQYVYRCTDSMLFTSDYLRRIRTTLIPFRECLDWELNIQTMFHQGKSWWADPPIAEQGTAVGRQITSLHA